MVESSKILTVSYGTFSCTLEGFDDSFSTMKAIAEYFRDLAAGDRYFGAEPPTPDAEMLTRIAEREISRRVEMRSSTTGIVLRASEPDPGASMPQVADTQVAAPQPQVEPAKAAPEKAPAPQVADLLQPANAAAAADIETLTPEADETPVAAQEPAPAMPPAPRPPQQRPAVARAAELARASAEDADVADDTTAVAADTRPDVAAAPPRTVVPAHPDADSVAAKLQRIRAVVGGVPLATPSAYAEDQDDAGGDGMGLSAPTSPKAEPTPDDTVQPREGTADVDVAPAATKTDPVPLPDAGADESFDAADGNDGDLSRAAADDAAEQDAAEVEIDGDAVTSAEENTDSATTDEASEDAESDATDDTDDQISAVLRNLRRAGLRQTPRDQAAAAPVAAATPDDAGDMAPRDADAAANPTPVVAPVVRPAAPRGRILRVTRRPRDPEAAVPPQPSTAPAPAAVTPATPTPAQAASPEASAEDNAPKIAASETPAAAIVPEAAAADETRTDDTPSSSHEDDFADSVAARDGAEDLMDFDPGTIESTLSEDDEADLQRELAALAAEQEAAQVLRAAAAPAETDANHAQAQDDAHPKARRDPLPGTSEAEMSRIMSQADDELADPEASRRRNAIAHLKAAVAATEAARQLGEPKSDRATTEDVFRDDLQKVVQPRRASRPEATTERSERPRPAPLKLVASQRIDLVDTAPAEPVQPRRIATPAAAATTAHEVGNFAEFAAQMGATSLQDLLEAAAAYTAFVEGSEDFSRPHIMQKVKQTVAEDFSREDGLRSFGTLLRQGRIERVRNGRFAVSARTRFRPESMVAGG